MTPIRVGLLGIGTVGSGTFRVLARNQEEITRRAGRGIRIDVVADRDNARARAVVGDAARITEDAFAVVRDPAIDIVVELIGGYTTARQLMMEAISHGKHVVTANKALLALHGNEIFQHAREKGVMVAFEAAVAGGIPIIKALREGLTANRIQWIAGIINGTSNFILSEMRDKGLPFDAVLAEAQRLGYAEADPTFDVEGIDAAHKLALLTTMAFGAEITFKDIPTEGIRGLMPLDFELAAEFGYRIKLLGVAKSHRGADGSEAIEVHVRPTMIPASSLLAKVDGAMNAVVVRGNAVGPTLYYGAGAGEMPTASAVVSDLMEIAREIARGGQGPVSPMSFLAEHIGPRPLVADSELSGRAYVRMIAQDRPGVLGRITSAFGAESVGIASVVQREQAATAGGAVPVIVLTHPASHAALRCALERLRGLGDLVGEPRVIEIEEGV